MADVSEVCGLDVYEQERIVHFIHENIRKIELSTIVPLQLYRNGDGECSFTWKSDDMVDYWFICLKCHGTVVSIYSSDVVYHVLTMHDEILENKK